MTYKLNGREIEIDYHYTPIRKGTHTLKNFDPGEPDSGGTIDDIKMTYYSEFYKKTFTIEFNNLKKSEQKWIEGKIYEYET